MLAVRLLKAEQRGRDDAPSGFGVEAFGFFVERKGKEIADQVGTVQTRTISQSETSPYLSAALAKMRDNYKQDEDRLHRIVEGLIDGPGVINSRRVLDLVNGIFARRQSDIAVGERLRFRDTQDATAMYAREIAEECASVLVDLETCKKEFEHLNEQAKSLSMRIAAAIAAAVPAAEAEKASLGKTLSDNDIHLQRARTKLDNENAKWSIFKSQRKIDEYEKDIDTLTKEKQQLDTKIVAVQSFLSHMQTAQEDLKREVKKPNWGPLGVLRW